MGSFFTMLKAYLTVCRYEYFPGELIALFIPILLTAGSWDVFYNLIIIEGVITFIILYLSGFLINAWTDRKIDAKYQNFKSSIAWGVGHIGERRLKAAIIIHLALSVILGAHISYQMGSLVPMLIIVIGIFFGFGYSMQPLSFKTRGVLFHFISLSLCCFFIPLVFLFYVVMGTLTWEHLLFASGFAMVHYALEIGNQILDYEEDLAEDLRTPPVRIGLKKSLGLALFSFLLGLPIMVAMLFYWFNMRGMLPLASPVISAVFTFLLVSLLLLVGYLITIKGLYMMYYETKRKDPLELVMKRIRSHINYALWQISGVSGLFTISMVLFTTG